MSTNFKNPFSVGFTEGYQTMDALGSITFGGFIIVTLKEKGYNKLSDQLRISTFSGIIAGAGLLFVYGGLMYIGATSSSIFSPEIGKSVLLISSTAALLGSIGNRPQLYSFCSMPFYCNWFNSRYRKLF